MEKAHSMTRGGHDSLGDLVTDGDSFHNRIIAIGREIFALAEAEQPGIWQSQWWTDQATRIIDRDDRLRARVFEFVECLPSLGDDSEITRHLAEYLDPSHVNLPKVFHAAVGSGPLEGLRRSLIGRAARFGATQMAGRFITGFDIPSLIKTLERLRKRGMAFTLDVLGESTTSYVGADRYAQVYHDVLDRLSGLAGGWPTIPMIDYDAEGPMPRGDDKPDAMRVSIADPSRFPRWIFLLTKSVQYILPSCTSRAMPQGYTPPTRISTSDPSSSAR